ncbi:hypothetical protein, partial [Escherichia coli]
MTVFNKFARTFKSHWLLYLCVIWICPYI